MSVEHFSNLSLQDTLAEAEKLTVLTKFRLMDLDYYVRRMIIDELVHDDWPIRAFQTSRYDVFRGIQLIDTARAGDVQLRLETIIATLQRSRLDVHSHRSNEKLQEWLSGLDLTRVPDTSLRTAFDAVQSLYFPYFSRFPHARLAADKPNNDIELMSRCTNLRTAGLHFHYAEIHNSRHILKEAPRLRREYRLDAILEFPKLQRLEFFGECDNSLMCDVRDWFKEEFQKRGRKVDVTLPEDRWVRDNPMVEDPSMSASDDTNPMGPSDNPANWSPNDPVSWIAAGQGTWPSDEPVPW